MSAIAEYIRPYQKLIVWQEAHRLCLHTYHITKKFPSDERFGLVSQMRRSTSSVPTNLAEGSTKQSKKERAHFYEMASTSLEELHYQYLLIKDLKYITQEDFEHTNNWIRRISFLITKLRSSLKE